MKYRRNQQTGDKISEIGIGSAYLPESAHGTAVEGVRFAFENGINYFDLAAGDGKAFPIFRDALEDVRSQVLYQIHFGADYSKGTYGWTLDLDQVKRSVDWQLGQLHTDYIDYGFIHCQDEQSDWDTYRENGVLQYLQGLVMGWRYSITKRWRKPLRIALCAATAIAAARSMWIKAGA